MEARPEALRYHPEWSTPAEPARPTVRSSRAERAGAQVVRDHQDPRPPRLLADDPDPRMDRGRHGHDRRGDRRAPTSRCARPCTTPRRRSSSSRSSTPPSPAAVGQSTLFAPDMLLEAEVVRRSPSPGGARLARALDDARSSSRSPCGSSRAATRPSMYIGYSSSQPETAADHRERLRRGVPRRPEGEDRRLRSPARSSRSRSAAMTLQAHGGRDPGRHRGEQRSGRDRHNRGPTSSASRRRSRRLTSASPRSGQRERQRGRLHRAVRRRPVEPVGSEPGARRDPGLHRRRHDRGRARDRAGPARQPRRRSRRAGRVHRRAGHGRDPVGRGLVESREGRARRRAISPAAPAAEAYRTLATNIRFLRSQRAGGRRRRHERAAGRRARARPRRTSRSCWPRPVCRTLLVDADLRRPRAERFLGVPTGRAP